MEKIKVLLADDQKLFVDGMMALLKPVEQIEVIGKVYNGEEVLEFLETEQPDVLVLDIEMPKLDGVKATEIIKKQYPDIKILILSMYNQKGFITRLMSLGASGYILKNKSKEELVSAIYNVNRGNAHYGLEVINELAKNRTSTPQPIRVELSDRQVEVLKKIAEGYTTKQISENLFISEPTVNTHRRNLLKKLNVPNEKFLVRYAIREGYIDA